MAVLVERLSPLEYLRRERQSETKSEYLAGQVHQMAGASERHNLITVNVGFQLHGQLRQRPWRIYASNMRVKISQSGAYTYPDVTVVCDAPRFEGERRDTLLNPTVIIEVLSPSTERYDRGQKFQLYRSIESLTEYLLIAQDAQRVEHYVRQSDGQWLLSEASEPDQTIHLPTIRCDLLLADVYDKVEFDPPDVLSNEQEG